MQCPVCLEDFTSINILSCSHPLCDSCATRWTQNCPLCRDNSCVLNIDNITEKIYKLPKYSGPKNTSPPISQSERLILTNIFGKFSDIKLYNIPLGSRILYQNFKSNHWWFGIISEIHLNSFTINNSIYYNRNNGSIYKATPSTRSLEYNSEDQIFLIK